MIIPENPHLFGYLCKLIHFWGNVRIKFNPTQNVVTTERKASSKVSPEIKYFLLAFMVLVYAHQFIQRKSGSPMETVTAWNCLMLLVASQSYIHQLRIKSSEIAVLFNSIFQLDSTYPNTCKARRDSNPVQIKAMVAFAYILVLTAVLYPIGCVYGLHWINPCKTTLVGYWLIRKCYSGIEAKTFADSVVDLVSKFVVLLANHWVWSFSFHASCFGTGAIHGLAVASLQQIIQRLKTDISNFLIFHKILFTFLFNSSLDTPTLKHSTRSSPSTGKFSCLQPFVTMSSKDSWYQH